MNDYADTLKKQVVKAKQANKDYQKVLQALDKASSRGECFVVVEVQEKDAAAFNHAARLLQFDGYIIQQEKWWKDDTKSLKRVADGYRYSVSIPPHPALLLDDLYDALTST